MSKFLTKSRFKLALECPTKLYYEFNKAKYYNSKIDDKFMQSLAEGGYQVGELAKLYYPGGHNIETLEHSIALSETAELLKLENVTIYEAAFGFKDFFIRTDILVKIGNTVKLIEVKAKSYNKSEDSFTNRDGEIKPEWKPYLFDIAFQKHVVHLSNPQFAVSSFLLLADKTATASIDGLNQMFLLLNENGRIKIKTPDNIENIDLGEKLLTSINVDDEVKLIFDGTYDNISFDKLTTYYAKNYVNNSRISSNLGAKCGGCEYFSEGDKNGTMISGYHECWKNVANFTDADFKKPQILNLWDFRRKEDYIKNKMYFLEDLTRNDLDAKTPKTKAGSHLSRVDRQELQINLLTGKMDLNHYIDVEGLSTEMDKWIYPLHFIDFETSAVAIPFNRGRKPYEQIAFQFSHHKGYKDGVIEHAGEWINTKPGVFPNFQFVRELKKQLDNDKGTIFRYAAHENTILNAIYIQLLESNESDKNELCEWIKTITKSKSSLAEKWEGERNMVDLRDLVLKYYYHPLMASSNSIKNVLPAILNESEYLKEKYKEPIYGNKIKSLNFSNQIWITIQNGIVNNPYSLLEPVHSGFTNESLETLITGEDDSISDGGAAMLAYAKMQFSKMSDEERTRITNALLRYCELDTFAMVLIWEAWNNWCTTKI